MREGIIMNTKEIIGYMPKRGDFDHEYGNEAEKALADLEFFDDDNEQIIKKKLLLIDVYNA
jgi:transcriptional adapter 2-alpha